MKIQPFSKTYDGITVLDFPGMELEAGKIYAIIGANGSGKSTFAKILAGVLSADTKGKPLEGITVGYLPQKVHPFRMSTRGNLLLNGKNADRADALMEALQIKHLAGKRADRLSGGETSRMALARLLMGTYDLVILDEPTAAMDMQSTSLSEALMVNYVRETGCTLLLVTHSLQQARRMGDEALYFCQGKLLESGPKERVLYEPTQGQTKQFLEFYGV